MELSPIDAGSAWHRPVGQFDVSVNIAMAVRTATDQFEMLDQLKQGPPYFRRDGRMPDLAAYRHREEVKSDSQSVGKAGPP